MENNTNFQQGFAPDSNPKAKMTFIRVKSGKAGNGLKLFPGVNCTLNVKRQQFWAWLCPQQQPSLNPAAKIHIYSCEKQQGWK